MVEIILKALPLESGVGIRENGSKEDLNGRGTGGLSKGSLNKHCEVLVSCSGQKIQNGTNRNLQGPSGTLRNCM